MTVRWPYQRRSSTSIAELEIALASREIHAPVPSNTCGADSAGTFSCRITRGKSGQNRRDCESHAWCTVCLCMCCVVVCVLWVCFGRVLCMAQYHVCVCVCVPCASLPTRLRGHSRSRRGRRCRWNRNHRHCLKEVNRAYHRIASTNQHPTSMVTSRACVCVCV